MKIVAFENLKVGQRFIIYDHEFKEYIPRKCWKICPTSLPATTRTGYPPQDVVLESFDRDNILYFINHNAFAEKRFHFETEV